MSSSGTGRGLKRSRTSSKTAEGKDEPHKKVSKRIKSPSNSKETPPKAVKAVRRESTDSPTMDVAKPLTTATLGSLPLHGESLPNGGYNDIPKTSTQTCDQLREVFVKIKSSHNSETEREGYKMKGLVLFSYLKRLNRLAHLYCKDSREQTHEQKLGVDDLHLQLQNLMYESMHLRKEITNCLEFKSQHEDIELAPEEEMYLYAPESISLPAVTRSDKHQRMLSRLQWEMEERKTLSEQRSSLEGEIGQLDSDISGMESKLAGLLPSLEELRKATLPLQESLGVTMDKDLEERELSLLLPKALYVLFTQAKAYAQVQDSSLSVTIKGDLAEAKAFHASKDKEQSDDDSGDSDNETKASRRKKHRKRSKGARSKHDLSKPYPLAVVLTITIKGVGALTVTVSYLAPFKAICASVSSLSLDSLPDSQIEHTSLLHCLSEGDTGRTSPNSIVSLNIRKHSGDAFSAAVRENGFPYKWVQKVCGIVDQSDLPVVDSPGNEDEFQWLNDPQVELSAQYLESVIKSLKKRFQAQVYLAKQIISLSNEGHKIAIGPKDQDTIFHGKPTSVLSKWKSISHSDVKSQLPQVPTVAILNPQERTNKYYSFSLQMSQARLYGIVCVGLAYPDTPPCFAVSIEENGSKESGTIQTKNIESEVNIFFPRGLHDDQYGMYLLSRQLRRLQECFELYVAHKQSRGGVIKTAIRPRGSGRLINLSTD